MSNKRIKEIICPKCRFGTLEPFGSKRNNETGKHYKVIGCDECQYSEDVENKSLCCDSDMFAGGQCVTCGADGLSQRFKQKYVGQFNN